MKNFAKQLHEQCGSKYVLLKGGHLFDHVSSVDVQASKESIDILFDGKEFFEFKSPWINTRNTHGTGCTFSAAITAILAKQIKTGTAAVDMHQVVAEAKQYLSAAVEEGSHRQIGSVSGHGPLWHMPSSNR